MDKNEVMKTFKDEVFDQNTLNVYCHENKGIYLEIQNQNRQDTQVSLNAESSLELLKFLNDNISIVK